MYSEVKMNERKYWWPLWRHCLKFVWREWEKLQRTCHDIYCLAKTQTENLLNWPLS